MPWRKRAFGPGTKYVFLEIFLGILGALCKEKGAPLVRTTAQPESHFTCSSPRDAPSGGTKYTSFELLLGILGGPGEARGGGRGTVPLQNPKVTSRKACLRNAE